MGGVLSLLIGGCTTGLGPKAVRSERPDYNQQIARSADAEMLLNLVRLRYNDTPVFLELGSVVAQYGYDASFNAGGDFGSGSGATVGAGLMYAEKPTITYTPLAGDKFATRMLTPIPLDALMLLTQTGWSDDRLLLVVVQRANDVFNAPTATGPTPARQPDYESFADVATRLHRLQAAGLAGLNWDVKESDSDPPGRNPKFWIHSPRDPHSPLAADVAAVRRALDLQPGRDDFRLTAYPFERQPDEVGLRCRSLLAVLYYLAQSVEPPAGDVQANLVTTTVDDEGQPFDWRKVTGRVMAIHSQHERPQNAYVAVAYRGSWFYIADDDRNSKATFGLLNFLFSLTAASGRGESPLLTLPIGR
ncbi:MAG: hypothetical protein ACRERC_17920 [Candidatus Binatia bacterium]